MKLINLSAHDQFQLNIARYLDRHKIFYERREKEWINEKKSVLLDYTPVGTKDVAQWLSTLHTNIGFGRARSRLSELFQNKLYGEIFRDFDKELKSSKYPDLARVVWAGLFIKNLLYWLPAKKRGFAKMSQLLLVKLVTEAIRNGAGLSGIVDEMLSQHRFGSEFIPKHLIEPVREVVANFVELQRKAQRRDPNIDFSNFFKRDDLSRNAFRKCCASKTTRRVSALLTRHIERVE